MSDSKRPPDISPGDRRSETEVRTNPFGDAIGSPFQPLIENAFDVIQVVDADCRTIYVSPSVRRVLGYDVAEVLGETTFSFVHPDDTPVAEEVLTKIIDRNERSAYSVIRCRHKNGTWRNVEFIAQNLLTQPPINGIVLNYRDITDRLEALEALRRSEEIYHKAFRSSPNSVTLSSLDGKTMFDVNDAFTRITGYTRDEFIGRPSLPLWKSEERRAEFVKHLAEDSVVRGFAADFVTKSGDTRNCVVAAEIITLDDRKCIVAVTRDVTEQLKSDNALRTATERLKREHQDLREKNIALKQILDHIEKEKSTHRHDVAARVENLLAPIIAKLKRSGGVLDPKDVEFLEQNLGTIIDSDIDHFENNLAKLTPRELDICDLLKAGRSSKEIADELGLSSQTINKHRQSIRRKLQIDNKEINLAAFLRSH